MGGGLDLLMLTVGSGIRVVDEDIHEKVSVKHQFKRPESHLCNCVP